MPTPIRSAALAALASLVLAGCSNARVKLCPSAAVLAAASSLTAFRGGDTDPSDALYTVRITDVSTDCTPNNQHHETDSSLDLTFRATRQPSARPARYTVPYFVAVTQGANIYSKRNFSVQFDFAPGASVATFTDRVGSTVLRFAKNAQPTDYQILAGLQLTQAERAYNKKMGRFAP